ncbi:MAG: hypothetical protein M1833_006871 [Piccolia ochrophora]|nr:MAG: hypothetical protein M1833_006871 [Piccolia ochrophora]
MPPVIDVHTHVYPPSYIELLRSRSAPPYIRDSRFIILPGGDRGRPVGPEYYDIAEKIAFMDAHGIDISVISLANPWLDFVPTNEAANAAVNVNDEIEGLCKKHPGRLYAFGALPLSARPKDIIAEIGRLKKKAHIRGVIMGSSGLGQGLDDPNLDEIWKALEEQQLLVFLHPHYGLPNEVYGPRVSEYGHVLPIALGFPLETTIAVTRMLLAKVFDRFENLKVLLAHSGGTLPFLAGRIESCIEHDAYLTNKGAVQSRRDIWDVLKTSIYLDAVIYSAVGLRTATEASSPDRVMFGTDHPFFPPLNNKAASTWMSASKNNHAIDELFGDNSEIAHGILGTNAARVLSITQ